MALAPEERARVSIDELLSLAGWAVQDYAAYNPAAARGIALREVPLTQGRCDYSTLRGEELADERRRKKGFEGAH